MDKKALYEFEHKGQKYCITQDAKRDYAIRLHCLGKDSLGNESWRQVLWSDSTCAHHDSISKQHLFMILNELLKLIKEKK